MDTTERVKIRPKTMAELLPELKGLFSDNAMKTMTNTATKKPRPTIANAQTTGKVFKPMKIADMITVFRSLQPKSPRNNIHQGTASVKRKWNSSCKLENKTVSHTANGQMKHNTVRKVLNFQPPKPKMPKPSVYSRITSVHQEIPKFPKPEMKAKKTLHLEASNTIRISGICNIPETPVVISKPIKTRMTIANKENISQTTVYKKAVATPKSTLRKKVLSSRIPDTPRSNESWKSSCDASFLQNERDIENKTKALIDVQTIDNIADVSLPTSTPFTEYRNVNNSNAHDITGNTYHDDTILSFDNTIFKENGKRDDSVILTLCNKLNEATVLNQKNGTVLDVLVEVQKKTENNIKMLENMIESEQNSIKTLINIKELQIKSFQYLNRLIKEERQASKTGKEKTVIDTKETTKVESVQEITKSPKYKIPKKYTCMRKNAFYKSMPNITGCVTPQKDMGERARSMYLKMKERNIYLSSPVIKQRTIHVPDTPAMTSHNLQKQLDKLYDEN